MWQHALLLASIFIWEVCSVPVAKGNLVKSDAPGPICTCINMSNALPSGSGRLRRLPPCRQPTTRSGTLPYPCTKATPAGQDPLSRVCADQWQMFLPAMMHEGRSQGREPSRNEAHNHPYGLCYDAPWRTGTQPKSEDMTTRQGAATMGTATAVCQLLNSSLAWASAARPICKDPAQKLPASIRCRDMGKRNNDRDYAPGPRAASKSAQQEAEVTASPHHRSLADKGQKQPQRESPSSQMVPDRKSVV